MDLALLPTLGAYIGEKSSSATEPGELARIQNIRLDERSPNAGITLYRSYLGTTDIQDRDDWNDRHNSYVAEILEIDRADPSLPWTFRPENAVNRLPTVDPRINLIRVEDARWPCSLIGESFETAAAHIESQRGAAASKANAAKAFLSRLANTWNAERDKRPLFATTELEVEDILSDKSPSVGERLRDRLGLGHYSPAVGASPVPVFVMRYPLEEVYAIHGKNGAPAVPTMLDGRLSDFFFPTPMPGPKSDQNPCLGHCLNLTLVDSANDYKLGVELLHGYVEYQPEHFFLAAVIANAISMPIDRARRFHLPWLRLYRDRDDFGIGILD